jgi:SAM-dependent methyltransferase
MRKDYLWIQLLELPYFRALLRAVEAPYYEEFTLAAPVLDIGAGDGHFAQLVFDRKIDVGIDPWHEPIQEAKKYGGYQTLIECDGAKIPVPNGYFASGFSNSVLEHIPHVDDVLKEAARVLKPGALFLFCVPNPRYLTELSIARLLGKPYADWFGRVSRVRHADNPDVWQARLEKAGFRLERWWHYFTPSAMRAFEWGHYMGLPSLVVRKLTGRWILVPTKWNLWLTERFVRQFTSIEPCDDGTMTFYVAYRR